MQKRSTLGIMIASTILATGCGGGGGSGSSENVTETPENITISGRAADGYLVQANVCADLNANGRCDAGEPN
jgi:ABC-type glycerol-3-phosphate transport system substrate-binding protein